MSLVVTASPALNERLKTAGAAGLPLSELAGMDRIAIEAATLGGRVVQVCKIVGKTSVRVAILAELAAAVADGALAVATEIAKAKGKKAPKDPLDRYYTPVGLARQLGGEIAQLVDAGLDGEAAPQTILEPSVGSGAWLPALRAEWPKARILGVDIDPAAAGLALCDEGIAADLLSIPADLVDRGIDLAVGNPPFSHAIPHLRHLLKLVREGGLVCLLLPATIGHLAGWASLPLPEREIPLQGRPAFLSPALSTESSGNGKTEYSLFVWRVGATPTATLRSRALAWRGTRQPPRHARKATPPIRARGVR